MISIWGTVIVTVVVLSLGLALGYLAGVYVDAIETIKHHHDNKGMDDRWQ